METKSILKIKIKEQEELLELINQKLRNMDIIKEEIGDTPYLEETMNFYLDQFGKTTRKLENLKNKLDIIKKEYQLFPEKWKIKNRYYEKRNKKRNR